jgi:hypothetical protein
MSESERNAIGERARARILAKHTAAHRAAELESYAIDLLNRKSAGAQALAPRNRRKQRAARA